MPTASDMMWFKLQFGPQLEAATKGTPFDADLLTAIACQETGYIWATLRKKGLAVADILALCVGDTFDDTSSPPRRAFPRNKAALLAKPSGKKMFDIGRKALVDLAKHVPGYSGAVKNPDKFCRGYGVFQYDLQFFELNPAYFLGGGYADFKTAAKRCVDELKEKQAMAKGLESLRGKTRLTDLEMAHVAIAYNTGRYDPARGLAQGHGGTYGQNVYNYLLKSRSVTPPADIETPGQALTPPPSAVTAQGAHYVVDTREGLLNLRSAPVKADNVRAGLPDGHPVRAVGTPAKNGFLEVETTLAGALLRGFVSESYLKKAPRAAAATAAAPAPAPAPSASTPSAAHMPRRAGALTRRADKAGAHSLNEAGAPGRKGQTPAELCGELAAIIDWLDVANPAHARYAPREGMTFCNIYAHDYCHLAGAYLPRVWWTPGAILAIGQGKAVEPKYGDTIEEMRANALFRWLRDFGPAFGWRQTGSLDKLQQHANQGGVGLIVARRTHEGKPGHVVAVVPETDANRAKRDASGVVTSPLQSEAGMKNARYGTKADWWKGAQFAESGYWIHP